MKIRNEDRGSKEGGFTLFELLISLAITGIVISLAGSGLYTLMTANQRSQIETTDRLELEQALAFMTDEIKMSQQVMVDMPLSSTATDRFRPASGIRDMQSILILKPASNSGLKNPIIYYLADPPNDSVWIGPRVIYRWGPTLSQNGNYSDGDGRDVSASSANINVEYYNEVVIDRISDLAPTQTTIPCESSYSYKPSNLVERLGFYACIAPDKRSVKLWMHKHPNPAAKNQSISSLVVTRSN
jgi:prepilin-type N-terminal cleavage/methylation domain-containing protein